MAQLPARCTNALFYFRHAMILNISGVRDYYLTDAHLVVIKDVVVTRRLRSYLYLPKEDGRYWIGVAHTLWLKLLTDSQKAEIRLEYYTEKTFDSMTDERVRISTRKNYRTNLAFTRMSGSALMCWILGTALAMSPLELPAYVILWILQACSNRVANFPEVKLVRCLQGIAESRRRVIRGRLGAGVD